MFHNRLSRIAPYALVAAAGLFLLYTAINIDYQHRAGTLGPDFWPKLILALLLIVCVGQILYILLADAPDVSGGGVLEQIAGSSGTTDDVEPQLPAESHPGLLLSGMAITVGYVMLVATTGFALTTAAYLAAFLYIGGYRRHRTIAVLSIGGSLLLMFIFMKLVYVSLPLGSGPFSELTILLMKIMGIR